MTLKEYKKHFSEDDAVGWHCIDKIFDNLYPNQKPQHFAPRIPHIAGGNDPLNGISIYNSNKQDEHFHFVSYGFSELFYNEKAIKNKYSKWGFELTFRLKPFEQDKGNMGWVISLMQNLARYVYTSEKWFEEFHFIPANGPIRLDTDTEITALAFVLDPEIGKIETPHGEVSFLQMVGITSKEYEVLKTSPTLSQTEKLIKKLKKTNPLLITDLNRK